jgi:hypothetical protein
MDKNIIARLSREAAHDPEDMASASRPSQTLRRDPRAGEPALSHAIQETARSMSGLPNAKLGLSAPLLNLLRCLQRMEGFKSWSEGAILTLQLYEDCIGHCIEHDLPGFTDCRTYLSNLASQARKQPIIVNVIVSHCSEILARGSVLPPQPQHDSLTESGVILGPELHIILERMLNVNHNIQDFMHDSGDQTDPEHKEMLKKMTRTGTRTKTRRTRIKWSMMMIWTWPLKISISYGTMLSSSWTHSAQPQHPRNNEPFSCRHLSTYYPPRVFAKTCTSSGLSAPA